VCHKITKRETTCICLSYTFSSSAAPFYAWGALAGFIGLVHNGFYNPLPNITSHTHDTYGNNGSDTRHLAGKGGDDMGILISALPKAAWFV
jgi:hypothetical protein